MTDRERAEQALKDAGYELSDEPYSGAHWWHASRWWTARFVQGLNEMKLEVGVPVRDVPTLIPFPSLTAEERNALEYFADGEYHVEPLWDHKAKRVAEEHHQAVLAALRRRLGGDTSGNVRELPLLWRCGSAI